MPSKTLTTILSLAFVLVCGVGVGYGQGQKQQPDRKQADVLQGAIPLTVCQVLRNLQSYRGKIIKVQGVWYGNTLEGSCLTELKTGDYKWLNAIYLTLGKAKEGERIAEPTIDFTEWKKAESELHRLQPGPVIATIIGEFDAKDKLEVYTGGYYPKIPIGFGSGGIYPAQIFVSGVVDITGAEPNMKEPQDLNRIRIQ